MIDIIRKIIFKTACKVLPELEELRWLQKVKHNSITESSCTNSIVDNFQCIYPPYNIHDTKIGHGTYVAHNSFISMADIGKYCSIGPNVMIGRGIHPVTGLSTSPVFYSTHKQAGFTYSKTDKVTERKKIEIGNDVFIGMNVLILDGVKIGDGAVIGAGAVVSKDIPPYAIAVGSPIVVQKYRFSAHQIAQLQKIKWWSFDSEKILDVEKYFFDIDEFIRLHIPTD